MVTSSYQNLQKEFIQVNLNTDHSHDMFAGVKQELSNMLEYFEQTNAGSAAGQQSFAVDPLRLVRNCDFKGVA